MPKLPYRAVAASRLNGLLVDHLDERRAVRQIRIADPTRPHRTGDPERDEVDCVKTICNDRLSCDEAVIHHAASPRSDGA